MNTTKKFLLLLFIGCALRDTSGQTWIVTNPPSAIFTTNFYARKGDYDLIPRVNTNAGIPNARDYTSDKIQFFLRKREGLVLRAHSAGVIGGKLIVTYNVLGIDHALVEAKISGEEAYRLSENSSVQLGVGYYRGLSYQKNLIVQKKWITGFASEDKKRIVLVPDDGPIRFSDNYGMTWNYISKPGHYRFTISQTEKGSAIFTEITIDDSDVATNKTANRNWYSTVEATDNTKLVVSDDPSRPAPVLQISQSETNVIISWPPQFTNYQLQQSVDMQTWEDVTNSVNASGETNSVILPFEAGNNFFRLRNAGE